MLHAIDDVERAERTSSPPPRRRLLLQEAPHHKAEAGASAMATTDAVPAYVRAHLARRVYALVAMQVACTAAVAAPLVVVPSARAWVVRGGGARTLGAGGLALSLVLACCALPAVRGRSPWNVLALAAFALVQGALVGATCALVPPATLLACLAATVALFGALSLLGWHRARGLTAEESALDVPQPSLGEAALVLLATAGVLVLARALLVPAEEASAFSLVASVVGVTAFGAFVVHDTGQIAATAGVDDAVDAALTLYLDLLNLFLCALECARAASE
jgi:FtsH-binding integral membrane protein